MQFNQIVYKLCGEEACLKVVSILLKSPSGISGRGLAVFVGTSTFKMRQVLQFLASQGILKSTAVGKAHLYRLNWDHILVRKILLPLLDFQGNIYSALGQEIMAHLKPKPLAVILYGSIARGQEGPDSDLDLFFVYREKQKPDRQSKQELWMESITRRYGNFVSVRRGTILQLRQTHKEKNALIRNIIKEGKVIAGLSMTDLLAYGR